VSNLHSTRADVWGDEGPIIDEVATWSIGHLLEPTDPLGTARSAPTLHELMGETITESGIGHHRAMWIFDKVVLPATRSQSDPMNLAYVPSAPTGAASAFDLATSAANIFGGIWESGAGAIHAENQVLAWLATLLGWPQGAGGCFVAGGTLGNLSALVAARNTAEELRQSAGRDRTPTAGWAFAGTEDAHSSMRQAAKVMGTDVITVPGDAHGRLTGRAVAETVAHHGERLFAVVATSGTTNAGVVDDLAGVAEVCQEHNLWLHVDGAYGGAALLAPSARAQFAGIEQADSFIVDPHKWLFAPYDACALLYRNPELAIAAHGQHASYLDHVDRNEWNPSDLAVHLSRRPRGLPLWFSLATHGVGRYRAAVETCLTTAREVSTFIADQPYLRLRLAPQLSVVLFERVGWNAEDYATWSQNNAKAGEILCVPTRWQGDPVLRLVFVNPATTVAAVAHALRTLAPSAP
jgi:glutamate/tyrosine decarboxylase-like PLP-dependent enzyme